MVKLDVDTVTPVPEPPPEAGPDRALEPLPAAVAEGDVAVGKDVPQAAKSPITVRIITAAMINRLVVLESNRQTPGRRSCLAMVTEADESGEGRGVSVAPAPPDLSASGGWVIAL